MTATATAGARVAAKAVGGEAVSMEAPEITRSHLIYFSSTSENTRRFVAKLGIDAARIPLYPRDSPLAAAEPKTLRYRLLHVAARLVRGQRRRRIRIPRTWPWADQLHDALTAALNLPRPA